MTGHRRSKGASANGHRRSKGASMTGHKLYRVTLAAFVFGAAIWLAVLLASAYDRAPSRTGAAPSRCEAGVEALIWGSPRC